MKELKSEWKKEICEDLLVLTGKNVKQYIPVHFCLS